MQKITPCLWFDSNAEAAVNFYTSIFKNSRIGMVSRYGEAGHEIHGKPAGSVLTIEFELNGQAFTALNGGPTFKFNEAVSFQVGCESQEEIDYYWGKLSEDGDKNAQQCGWLKDKFGVSWQIVPNVLGTML
jgi:predicted 3-demethylubiquinone-9 3-methyltransferase (glyoxalase superfamily)